MILALILILTIFFLSNKRIRDKLYSSIFLYIEDKFGEKKVNKNSIKFLNDRYIIAFNYKDKEYNFEIPYDNSLLDTKFYGKTLDNDYIEIPTLPGTELLITPSGYKQVFTGSKNDENLTRFYTKY